MRLCFALVTALLLQTPAVSIAQAQGCESLRPAAETAGDPLELEHAGSPGIWFPEATARLMLCEVKEFRFRSQEIRLVDTELEVWKSRVQGLREALTVAAAIDDKWAMLYDSAEHRAMEAEARAESWKRSPVLWFGAGVAAAAAVFAGSVYAVDQLRR